MRIFRDAFRWLLGISLVLTLMQPDVVFAFAGSDAPSRETIPVQRFDDDDWDDDDWDDHDDWDDDEWDDDDDDWDDDDWDDDDWDDDDWDDDDWDDDDDDDDWDDDGDFDEDLDRPILNQALVQLSNGVSADDFASRYGASVLRHLAGPNIALLQLSPDWDDYAQLQTLLADPDVLWGELNYTNQAPEGRPRYFFTSSVGEPQVVSVPALPSGLEFTPTASCVTGSSVLVAVLDTGVDPSHPALEGSVLPHGMNTVDNTYDFLDTGNGLDDDGDGQIDEMIGHGTHVSGTILQVAPDANILPVKVLNSDGVGDTFSVTAGIYYAVQQGADVINLSLGTTYDSLAIRSAVDHAISEGVVVVAAAGNSARSQPLEFPAAAPSVISVASTTAEGDRSWYSNFSETVTISAPGDNVASAYPGDLYTTASGTSMSTAIVAGAIALVLEEEPTTSPADVSTLLQSTAGPLNLSDPTMAGMLGAGEVDVDATVSCAK